MLLPFLMPMGQRAVLTLCDLEAAALAQDEVGGRHRDVREVHLGVAVRRVVVAKHQHGPNHLRV